MSAGRLRAPPGEGGVRAGPAESQRRDTGQMAPCLQPPTHASDGPIISHWQVLETPLKVLSVPFVFVTVNNGAPDYPVTSAPRKRRGKPTWPRRHVLRRDHGGYLARSCIRHSFNCGIASAARHYVIQFRMTFSIFHEQCTSGAASALATRVIGPWRRPSVKWTSSKYWKPVVLSYFAFEGPPQALDGPN